MRWAKTTSGKNIPLDQEPTKDGNLWLDDKGVAHVVTGDDLEKMRRIGVPLHLSHFVTCPQRREWRREKKQQREAEHALQDAKREMFGGDAIYLDDDTGAR